MMKFGLIFTLCIFCFTAPLKAQIETYGRDNTIQEKDSVAPRDTITTPPVFDNSDDDFLRYLELHFNASMYRNQLKPLGDVIQFEIYINKGGDVDEFQVLSSTNTILNNEFKNIVFSMPKWKPGKVGSKNKKIRMVYVLRVKPSDTPPYVQINKEQVNAEYDPSTRNLKMFLVAGSLMILGTLLFVR